MDAALGTLQTIGGRPVLRFERRLRHPPEKVWRAITDPAELAHWFPAAVEAELTVGAPMRFTFEGADLPPQHGEVVEVDRPKLYVYRWGDDLMRWELIPERPGCRLVFTHTYGGTDPRAGALAAARYAAGWDGCLDLLQARLDGRAGSSTMAAWFERNERYVERFGLAEGEVLDRPDGSLVRFERDLIQPVGEAWAALTEGADPAVGAPPGRFTNPDVAAGPVTAVEPGHGLAYAWEHDGTRAGLVRWELVGQEVGARVVVTQTVPSRLAELRATALAGWQTHLELFVAALHGSPRPWPHERARALRRSYEDRL